MKARDRGRFSRGNTRAATLDAEDVIWLLARWNDPDSPWTQARLARHLGISTGQVGRICRGESWAHMQKVPAEVMPRHKLTPADYKRLSERLQQQLEEKPEDEDSNYIDPIEAYLNKRKGQNHG